MRALFQADRSKGPALARRLIALALIISMLFALVPAMPVGADSVTTFSDSSASATLTFSGAGNKTVSVLVPDDATVTKAGFDLDGQEVSVGAGFPTNVSIDVGKDGVVEW